MSFIHVVKIKLIFDYINILNSGKWKETELLDILLKYTVSKKIKIKY